MGASCVIIFDLLSLVPEINSEAQKCDGCHNKPLSNTPEFLLMRLLLERTGAGCQGYQPRIEGWNFQGEEKDRRLHQSSMAKDLLIHIYAMKSP